MQLKINKYFSIILFLLIVNPQLFAQANMTDDMGRKQGEWVKYKNGVVFYKGEFKDGYPIGEFKRYYSSGRLKMTSQFSDKGKRRFTEFYYDQRGSQLKAKGLYVEKKKDSIWQVYNKSGMLVNEEEFALGVAVGWWKLYDYLGHLVKETPYTDGKIDGVLKEYFENGHLKRTATFSMDTLIGDMNIYYPSSNIRIKGVYDNGLQDKEWIYYAEDAEILYIETYSKGAFLHRLDPEGNPFEIVKEQDTVRLDIDPSEIDF